MICPFCAANDDKVIDSRSTEGGAVIRRRRACLKCSKRFTTYERVEEAARLVVVKRDGTHVPFARDNVLRGVLAACGKRPIAEVAKAELVDQVEEELHRMFDREVPSHVIGELVMAKLRGLDQVAYIRFASEYHQFKDAQDMLQQIEQLKSDVPETKDQARLF